MSMWQFCWLVAFFFHGMRAMTQSLTGRVVDERERPLISVSLTLYNPADSSRVGGAVSGEDGGFSIPVAEGSYLLRASEMGYEEIGYGRRVVFSPHPANAGEAPSVGRSENTRCAPDVQDGQWGSEHRCQKQRTRAGKRCVGCLVRTATSECGW